MRKDVREAVKADLLMVRGTGGMFSLSVDGDGKKLVLEIFAFSELPKELRFRKRSCCFGLGWVLAAFTSLLESIPELDSVLFVTPLSCLVPAD